MALTRCTIGQGQPARRRSLAVTSGSRRWSGRRRPARPDAADADGWVLYVAGRADRARRRAGHGHRDHQRRTGRRRPVELGRSRVQRGRRGQRGARTRPVRRPAGGGLRSCRERDRRARPTGGLDQAIAIHGEAEHALLIDFAAGHPGAGALRPGRPRPRGARHRHEGQPRAHRRRLRLTTRRRLGGRGAARPRQARAWHRPTSIDGLPEPLRAPRAARRQRGRAGRRRSSRRCAPTTGPRSGR